MINARSLSPIPYSLTKVILSLALVSLLTACASTSTSTLYDTPNWMPDGRIICGKLVVKTSQQLYGGGISESHSYVAAFWPSGTGEVNLFESGGDEITCSPTGELIAYILNAGIYTSDYQGNKNLLPNTAGAQYLDWSPDATKLVYSDTSRDLYIINKDGTGKTKIATSAEAVAWRVGEKIVYTPTSTQGFNVINHDGANLNVIASNEGEYKDTGNAHQITNSGKVVYRGKNWSVLSIGLDGASPTQHFTGFDRTTLKLSFDNTKIVGGVTGDSGIWLINIDGTGYTKIR